MSVVKPSLTGSHRIYYGACGYNKVRNVGEVRQKSEVIMAALTVEGTMAHDHFGVNGRRGTDKKVRVRLFRLSAPKPFSQRILLTSQ